jgi:effector-binding domain-containing protein
VEPAHREAYVTIAKSLVTFPDILAAYDAVAGWIEERGEKAVGSPREVYFGDFEAAAPDDPVVDIAFPIASR